MVINILDYLSRQTFSSTSIVSLIFSIFYLLLRFLTTPVLSTGPNEYSWSPTTRSLVGYNKDTRFYISLCINT